MRLLKSKNILIFFLMCLKKELFKIKKKYKTYLIKNYQINIY